MTKILYAGHICVDIIPTIPDQPTLDLEQTAKPGSLVIVGQPTFSTGGSVSNSGIGSHIIGADVGIEVSLNGKIGVDHLGTIVKEIIREHGLDPASMTEDTNAATSYSIVLTYNDVQGKSRDRTFLHAPLANDSFTHEDINWNLVNENDLLHFGYPTLMRSIYDNDGEELVPIFRTAKQLGITTSLDMALPDPNSHAGQADWDFILQKLLPYVDIFMPSVEEALFMTDRNQYLAMKSAGDDIIETIDGDFMSGLSEKLLSYGKDKGVSVLVLKAGHKGAYLRTAPEKRFENLGRLKLGDAKSWADKELWHPCYHTNNPSANGAGDSMIAGMHVAMHKGLLPEDVLSYGCVAGYMNVSAPDALSGLRPWKEMESIRDSLKTVLLSIRSPGWNQISPDGVYIGPNNKV